MHNADYFIKLFQSIPASEWATGAIGEPGEKHCALGHCISNGCAHISLITLFHSFNMSPASVNDGIDLRYPQRSPKARILAALKDIKKGQSL